MITYWGGPKSILIWKRRRELEKKMVQTSQLLSDKRKHRNASRTRNSEGSIDMSRDELRVRQRMLWKKFLGTFGGKSKEFPRGQIKDGSRTDQLIFVPIIKCTVIPLMNVMSWPRKFAERYNSINRGIWLNHLDLRLARPNCPNLRLDEKINILDRKKERGQDNLRNNLRGIGQAETEKIRMPLIRRS